MRLDKFIANNSSLSRNKVNTLIKNKHIRVNGIIITDNSYKLRSNDKVFVNDDFIENLSKFYIALNKPKNYVCSNTNKDGESIINLIDEKYRKNIHIVGRLDKDTTGLIILTNDGDFTHFIKNPQNNIDKEYLVTTKLPISDTMINELRSIKSLDQKDLKPFAIKQINDHQLILTLQEGKYHQVKRMILISKNEVINLKRTRIGLLELNKLNIHEGQYKLINKLDIIKSNDID